jgi:hypothetical protein
MKKPVIKFEIDSVNSVYRVNGTALITDTMQTVNVGFQSFNYDKAEQEFNYYSDANGFECQKVIIRK